MNYKKFLAQRFNLNYCRKIDSWQHKLNRIRHIKNGQGLWLTKNYSYPVHRFVKRMQTKLNRIDSCG